VELSEILIPGAAGGGVALLKPILFPPDTTPATEPASLGGGRRRGALGNSSILLRLRHRRRGLRGRLDGSFRHAIHASYQWRSRPTEALGRRRSDLWGLGGETMAGFVLASWRSESGTATARGKNWRKNIEREGKR
jgi:hypothetical protein